MDREAYCDKDGYFPRGITEEAEIIRCSSENLERLPKLPSKLRELRLVDVPLESIPIIPDSVTTIKISLLPNPKRNPSFDAIVDTYNRTKDVEAFKRAVKEIHQRQPDVLSLAYGSKIRDLPPDSVTAIGRMLGSNPKEIEAMAKKATGPYGGKKTRRRNMRKKRTMKRKARRT